MSVFGGDEVRENEWNAVKGFWDIFIRLLYHYYEASLTPGIGDDLETLKRMIDHVSCKLDKVKGVVIEDFDKDIEEVERLFTSLMLNNHGIMTPDQRQAASKAKRMIRNIHRKLMICVQVMGGFDKFVLMQGQEEALARYKGVKNDGESILDTEKTS